MALPALGQQNATANALRAPPGPMQMPVDSDLQMPGLMPPTGDPQGGLTGGNMSPGGGGLVTGDPVGMMTGGNPDPGWAVGGGSGNPTMVVDPPAPGGPYAPGGGRPLVVNPPKLPPISTNPEPTKLPPITTSAPGLEIITGDPGAQIGGNMGPQGGLTGGPGQPPPPEIPGQAPDLTGGPNTPPGMLANAIRNPIYGAQGAAGPNASTMLGGGRI